MESEYYCIISITTSLTAPLREERCILLNAALEMMGRLCSGYADVENNDREREDIRTPTYSHV